MESSEPAIITSAQGQQKQQEGFYAVRKGTKGRVDGIFLSWDRCKVFVECDDAPTAITAAEVTNNSDNNREEDTRPAATSTDVEYCFFKKIQDAINYLDPNHSKAVINSTINANATIAVSANTTNNISAEKGDTNIKKTGLIKKKRKQLSVLGRPLKKLRIFTRIMAPNRSDKTAIENPVKMQKITKTSTSKAAANVKAIALSMFPATKIVSNGNIGRSPTTTTTTTTAANKNPTIVGSAHINNAETQSSPQQLLHIELQEAFTTSLPKGWRSIRLNLFLTRRDAFREFALKQYLNDLVELQEYRETHSNLNIRGGTSARDNFVSPERHISNASHPLSVFYLNWSWGVCNSYHRDIRRQQKNRAGPGANGKSSSGTTGGSFPSASHVNLPLFKAHSMPQKDKTTTGSTDTSPTTSNVVVSRTAGSRGPNAGTQSATKQQQAKPRTAASLLQPKKLQSVILDRVLEQGYLAFRPCGWRRGDWHMEEREQHPQTSSDTIQQESPEPANPTTIDNSKLLSVFGFDKKSLDDFCAAHPEELMEYDDSVEPSSSGGRSVIRGHPSGISSPYSAAYLKWAWDIRDPTPTASIVGSCTGGTNETSAAVGVPLLTKSDGGGQQATSAVVISESNGPGHENSTTATIKEAVSPPEEMAALPLQPTTTATSTTTTTTDEDRSKTNLPPKETGSASISTAKSPKKDNEIPPLIKRIRASWLQNRDKGWRAGELGFPTATAGGKVNLKQFHQHGPFSRKQREFLYLQDMEALKRYWAMEPSSHTVMMTPITTDEVGSPKVKTNNMADNGKFGALAKPSEKKHKSGINAPFSLTYLNWSWGVSNSYNRDLARKERRNAQKVAGTVDKAPGTIKKVDAPVAKLSVTKPAEKMNEAVVENGSVTEPIQKANETGIEEVSKTKPIEKTNETMIEQPIKKVDETGNVKLPDAGPVKKVGESRNEKLSEAESLEKADDTGMFAQAAGNWAATKVGGTPEKAAGTAEKPAEAGVKP